MKHRNLRNRATKNPPAILRTAIILACIPPAYAQEEAQPVAQTPEADEEMVVVGQSAQIRRALADQRRADKLKSILHSDGINALPDGNAAESLQRLPGISIERDQGEGRFVRIRGTAPNLNSTTIDGVRLTAPEDDQRAVALDVLPTGLVDSLVVTKVLTPDMDGDAVGGNVDVRTISALDKDRPFFKLSGRVGHNQLTDENNPKLSGSAGRVFNVAGGRLGVATAVSYEDRDFGSDNIETGGNWDFSGPEPGIEEIEERDYSGISRERTGIGLNVDFEQDENNRYHVRTLYTEFEDDEQRNANIIEFEEPLAEGETSGEAEFEKELKDRIETQEILSIKAGGEHRVNQWTLEYEGSFSEASEEEGFEEPALGEAIFVPEQPIEGLSFSGTRTPRFDKPATALADENFVFDSAELEKGDVTDEEYGGSFDLKREFTINNTYPASVKVGAKATRREKERDITLWAFEDFADNGINPGRLGLENFDNGEADWPFGQFGSNINPEAVRNLLSDLGPRENFRDAEESRVEDFEIDEDITAGYFMGTVDIDNLRLIGGVRYEDTSTDGVGTRFNAEQETFATEKSSNDYDNILPSLNARYEWSDRTLIRSSFFQSLARPVFEQLSPGIIIDADEAEFGNPQLDPLTADNLDLGIEHYISDTSALSAHLFYKNIDDFIFEQDLAGTGFTRRGVDTDDFSEAVTFENGEGGEVYGVELAASHDFSRLPGILSGLVASGNVTLTNSDATISGVNPETGEREQRDIDLPRQSDVTGNFSVGYEDEKIRTRLAGSFKSEYLLETGNPLDETQDIYEDNHFQLDFSGSYNFTEKLQLDVAVLNINNRQLDIFQNKSGFNAQVEEYERTYRIGLTYANF